MKEIQKIGNFHIYDRIRIKDTKITGNIVLIYDDTECEIELDDEYCEGDIITKTCNVRCLEKE